MVTVWKNLSNVATAVGDVTIYKKSYSWPVWSCLALMLLSAVVGASTDVRFSWSGYSWQIANCFFTSAYALYLRSVMDKVAEHTTNKQKVGGLGGVVACMARYRSARGWGRARVETGTVAGVLTCCGCVAQL